MLELSDQENIGDRKAAVVSISQKVYQPAKVIYYFFFRALLYVRCDLQRAIETFIRSPGIALPPPFLRYKVSENTDISIFLDVGQRITVCIEQMLNHIGTPLSHMNKVLDFGCGCGRAARWLIPKFPNVDFFGTDIDAMSIQWCREHLRGRFCVNQDAPPLGFPDAYFDCIYAISVFTHLGEEHQKNWLVELRRILRPGGVLLASVHGMGAIKELGTEDIATLRAQGILFKRSSKLSGVHPDFYHTTFQTKEYVLQTWSKVFEIVAYEELGLGYQDFVVLRRDGNVGATPAV